MSKTDVLTADSVFGAGAFPLRVQNAQHHDSGMPPHSHEFDELVLIMGGSGEHVTSHTVCQIDPGDVFFISRNMTHSFQNTVDLDVINVLFDVDALRLQTRDLHDVPGHHVLFHLEPQSRSAQQFRGRLTLSPEQRVRAGHMVEVLRAEIDGRAHGYRFASCALLMQLISFLSRCYVEKPSPEQRSLLCMGEVLSYIERNYSAPVSVADLAALAAMSESSLNRAFQRLVGKAPVEYVIGVRLDKAADLLRNTDRHITEIGLACGFSDGNYFSRRFRRRMGCSPRAYRQDMRASRDGAHVNGTSLSTL
jgi:AraC-like DNA-binding protein/uncharacterized cupin superfamily protein